MCLNPVQIKRYNPVLNRYYVDVVPCGHCIECLKRKQNDYAFISKRQALESGSLALVTLTFRDSTIPIGACYEIVDHETGQVLDRSRPVFVLPEYADSVRKEYMDTAPLYVWPDGRTSKILGWQLEIPNHYAEPLEEEDSVYKEWTYTPGRYTHLVRDARSIFQRNHNWHLSDKMSIRCVATPSLNRGLVKDWLKSAREAFYRQYGYRATFKYLEVGEYGTHTKRPHVHLLFYGARPEEIDFFVTRWRQDFGRVDVEYVAARGSDTYEQALEKVSKYLAKYLCKGDFEEEFVKDGYVEKPRRVSSRRLGTENLEELREYILAFDVFGEYDPDKPPKQVRENLDVLLERRYIKTYRNGKEFIIRIPKVVYDRCLSKTFGLSQEDKQSLAFSRSSQTSFVYRVSHVRSTLQRLLTHTLASRSRQRLVHDVEAIKGSLPPGSSFMDFCHAFTAFQNLTQQKRATIAKDNRKALSHFYHQSIF